MILIEEPESASNKTLPKDTPWNKLIKLNKTRLVGDELIIDVPGDNSCLFWAAALAYLLPVKNDPMVFQGNFLRLFGIEEINHLDFIKLHIQNYHPDSNTSLFRDDTFNRLIRNVFRERVINFMREHRDIFEEFYGVDIDQTRSFDNYLEIMSQDSSWGGDLEIRSIGMLLNCNVNLRGHDFPIHYPEILNHEIPTLTLIHTNAAGKDSGVKNHYCYQLNSNLVKEDESNCKEMEDFNYNHLTSKRINFHDEDCCTFSSNNVSLQGSSEKPFAELHCGENETKTLRGWKFHIILNQDVVGNVEKAWNCIVKLLMRYDIGLTKVIHPNNKVPEDKAVTIFACIEKTQRSKIEWQGIINQIVYALVENNVLPGQIPNEYKILDCYYVSYRNDLSLTGGYSPINNETKQPDPYKGMVVNVDGQEHLFELGLRRSKALSQSAPYPKKQVMDDEPSFTEISTEEIGRQFESFSGMIEENSLNNSNKKNPGDDEEDFSGCCPK